jgi:hypothetical protein
MTGRIHFGGGGRRKSQKLGCPTTTVFPGQWHHGMPMIKWGDM